MLHIEIKRIEIAKKIKDVNNDNVDVDVFVENIVSKINQLGFQHQAEKRISLKKYYQDTGELFQLKAE